MICDWKSLRVSDRVYDKTGFRLSVVSGIDPRQLYQALIGNPYQLKRSGEFVPVLRATTLLIGVAGDLPPKDADAFWKHQSCSPLEWDARHYDRTLPKKLEIMQQLWQQFCDHSEQAVADCPSDDCPSNQAEAISLFAGLKTKADQKKYLDLLEERNSLDYQAFLMLRDELVSIVEALSCPLDPDVLSELQTTIQDHELYDRIEELVGVRERINDLMIQLLAGQS